MFMKSDEQVSLQGISLTLGATSSRCSDDMAHSNIAPYHLYDYTSDSQDFSQARQMV
jgi:hypothetical protein